MTDMLKGWKTVTFNVLATIVPVLDLYEVRSIIPEQYLPFYALVIALGNVYLRFVTSTPVGKKQ